jgi:hypothetical protein
MIRVSKALLAEALDKINVYDHEETIRYNTFLRAPYDFIIEAIRKVS